MSKNKDVKNEENFLYLKYSRICEDIECSNGPYGPWKSTNSWFIKGVCKSRPEGSSERFCVSENIKVGDIIYVVYAVWSTGNSFGTDIDGRMEVLYACKEKNDVDNLIETINKQDKTTFDSSYSVTYKGEKIYTPWNGHFEDLSYINVEKYVVEA